MGVRPAACAVVVVDVRPEAVGVDWAVGRSWGFWHLWGQIDESGERNDSAGLVVVVGG